MKGKVPLLVDALPPDPDWWSRLFAAFLDACPYLFLIGAGLGLIFLIKWWLDRYWEDTVRIVDGVAKRQKEMDRRLAAIDDALSCYQKSNERVTQLERELQTIKAAANRRDPLEAIVKEQKSLGR